MPNKEPDTFCPASQKEWRKWLMKHHQLRDSVWLIYHKKKTQVPSLTWSQAVEEALCFGWIDSTARPIDDDRYMQFFTRRKPASAWSKINKTKVEELMADGRMTPAGLKAIGIAKENGSWTALDAVEELILPKDLLKEFRLHPKSKAFFMGLSKSTRKHMLHWIALAKRPETRQKRITEIVGHAANGTKPAQFR